MARNSRDILTDIRNKVDTAGTGWHAYAKMLIPAYDEAYANHQKILKAVDNAIKIEAEQGWLVLSMILSIAGAHWAPRLLKPVQAAGDELVKEWAGIALSKGLQQAALKVGDEVKSHVQNTIIGEVKNAVVGSGSNAFEPVVENTTSWGARLEEGILKRTFFLKEALDAQIKNADKWSEPAATLMEQAYLKFCPLIVDLPQAAIAGDSKEFQASFAKISELTMWRAWGLKRDEKWWNENPDHRDLWKYGIVFDRLVGFGVAPQDIGSWVVSHSTTIVSYHRPGWRFDMLKFIKWAKSFDPQKFADKEKPKPVEQVCRAVDERLILKRNPNACYVGDVR